MGNAANLQKGKPRLSPRYEREYIRDLKAGAHGVYRV